MATIETSRHFTPVEDAVSGAVYYVLKTCVAPQQQAFYFVNPSMDRAGRFLWFYCSFPPAAYRTLGLVCLETDTVHHFPDAAFTGGPLCDEETGDLYFTSAEGIFLRSPAPEKPLRKLCDLPGEIRLGALPVCPATHLTFSADRQEFFLDASAGNRKFTLGSIRLSDGRYMPWYTGDFLCNHAQFHPTDKDLVLYAEDYYTDPDTGKQVDIRKDERGVYRRLWTLRRGEAAPRLWEPLGNFATHEWWSSDGTTILYINEPFGIIGIDIATGRQTVYDPVPAWHGHCSADMGYFVADISVENDSKVRHYRGCPTRVAFYNRRTGKSVDIAAHIPAMNPPERPNRYHPDPHPRFNCGDRYILFTLNRTGLCEVAAAPVAPLIESTR